MYYRTFLVLVMLTASLLSAKAENKEGHEPAVREVISLDKGWKFHKGDIPVPFQHTKAGRAGGAASTAYNDSSWRTVDIPHDWAIEGRVDSTANRD